MVLKSESIKNMLKGLAITNPDLEVIPDNGLVLQRKKETMLVPIISGGGSGHEPAHFGYVGEGMLTGALCGELFVPPKAADILQAISLVNHSNGIFIIIKNFEADLAAFSEAIWQAKKSGIDVRYVISHDDISVDVANRYMVRHRGVAGTILLHKILGEASRCGKSIDEIEQIGLELSVAIHTIGAARSTVTLPGQKKPLFALEEDQVSLGIGIHGESGYRKETFVSLEYLANELINKLKIRCQWQADDAYIVLINNLGGLSEQDQFIFTNAVMRLLELADIDVKFVKSKKFMTSLDMAGISLTMCPVKQAFWLTYLMAETEAKAW